MSGEIIFDHGPMPGGTWFRAPQKVLRAHVPDEVLPLLQEVTARVKGGLWAAGFLSYEAGTALDPALAPLARGGDAPLLCFGLFDAPVSARDWLAETDRLTGASLSDPEPLWSAADHAAAIARVRNYIGAGDIYQANLTFPLTAQAAGSPRALYGALRGKQPVPHGAYVDLGDEVLLSRSPELFFEVAQGQIETRPMKGTVKRGRNPGEDAKAVAWLAQDVKNRAENLMIVDLLRNDLSRVSRAGSVKVPELFHVESYATVHQMTSRITAELLPGMGLAEIMTALFPCGSITGAPKLRAMEIIAEVEPEPRGPYCGAIGWLAPDGRMSFNVAIRTLRLGPGGAVRLNVGGGVVWDSTAEGEYEEALWKARFARI